MTKLDSILKSRYQQSSLPTKFCVVKAMGFPIVMHGCESLDYKESWVPKNWCFWTVVLKKTFDSPLKISPVSWMFFGRTDVDAETPILWLPDAKNWLTGKDPDARKDWRQEENGMTEDEMVAWHHWLTGHEFEQASGDGEGKRILHAAIHVISRNQTQLSNWTITSRGFLVNAKSFVALVVIF